MPHRVRYFDPLHSGRHPFQTYLLVLCMVSGFPLLFGRIPAESIEETLPVWLVAAWGAFLFGGAGVTLVGSYWRGGYDTALLLERMGLSLVGSGACAYAFVIFATAGWDRFLPSLIVLGFGTSCLRRARDISRIIHRAHQMRHEDGWRP